MDVILLKYPAVTRVRQAGDSIELEFAAAAQASLSIEASTDLVDWAPLATLSADSTGVARYTDSNAVPSFPMRFYRQQP